MELQHIALDRLIVSASNMRGKGKAPDLSNILPSVRARGILVPLIVRPTGEGDRYEIVAGRRRYEAAKLVAAECGESDPLPCAVMTAGDDASALEASLIENVARLDPDEVARWETFTRLVRKGRTSEDIALTFGLTELQVKRTLALGNLLPRIRTLYRRDEIDAATLRHLTMATKAQQTAWLALLDDEDAHCPTGQRLKAWLFGGASIPVGAALFDIAIYPGAIVSDLFGEDRWFADLQAFWTAQREAIEDRVATYREAGWSDVVILPEGTPFQSWEHEHTPKRKGGKVFVSVSHRGEVQFHEGYLTTKEARSKEKGLVADKPARPELSSATARYVDLHRHAVVRATLASRLMVALRVMVAHVIAGSPNWRIGVDRQHAPSDAIAESVEVSSAEAGFDGKRRAVLDLLGFHSEAPHDVGGDVGDQGVTGLFLRLCALSDKDVLDILVVVMGETLDVGTSLIEALGVHLAIDMADHWQADAALLDGIRDKAVLNAMLADVAGDVVAQANGQATGKVQRQIIADCLAGASGRAKVERWVPRWMAFPPDAYAKQGGVPTAERWTGIAAPISSEGEVATVSATKTTIEPLRDAA
jgi:ParB family chromosome partitioning protein